MYDRIIVPIEEGADVSSVASAQPIACGLGCTLTLLHVHHPKEAPAELEGLPQYRYQGVVESWVGRDQEAEADEVEWLEAMAAEIRAGDEEITVTSRVVHAPLAGSLREPDESVLVVVPNAAGDGVDPTVREILRGGGVPVLLMPGARKLPENPRMLITLDGSPFSQEILEPALELARATDARLSLLEVVTRHTGIVRLLRPGERSAESAERFLREVRGRIPEELGPVDVRVVEMGNAPAGIIHEARREDIDLIAMATHGRGGLRRFILGSVAESVVRSYQIPVLLYRPLGDEAGNRSPRSKVAADG